VSCPFGKIYEFTQIGLKDEKCSKAIRAKPGRYCNVLKVLRTSKNKRFVEAKKRLAKMMPKCKGKTRCGLTRKKVKELVKYLWKIYAMFNSHYKKIGRK
jgi:hypothetical protein